VLPPLGRCECHLLRGRYPSVIAPTGSCATRQWRNDEENLWRLHDQVICSLDSVKPLEGRRGWSIEQLSSYNRERFEDLISASWDLVIIDEAHRMGGSTDQVARYKLGAALAEAAPYFLLLSATPHQGKTDQFLRLMQLAGRDSFPDESSVDRDRVRPFVIRTEKRAAIDAEGKPLFKPRVTRLHAVVWQDRHTAQQQLYEAVTDYVRHGYNQAMAAKQRHATSRLHQSRCFGRRPFAFAVGTRVHLAPPAQIRTGPIRAYGSHLGCLTTKRRAGHG
jgi:SNF2-related domain